MILPAYFALRVLEVGRVRIWLKDTKINLGKALLYEALGLIVAGLIFDWRAALLALVVSVAAYAQDVVRGWKQSAKTQDFIIKKEANMNKDEKDILQGAELPLITDAADITPENCPEMFEELCNGCEEGEGGTHE